MKQRRLIAQRRKKGCLLTSLTCMRNEIDFIAEFLFDYDDEDSYDEEDESDSEDYDYDDEDSEDYYSYN